MVENTLAERRNAYRHACYIEPSETIKLGAERVLMRVRQWSEFRSVVDFGCSVGIWLDVARRLGATKTLGIEGHWISRADLVNQQIDLLTIDLESRVVLNEMYDLAISLEVAEHLSVARAQSFVEDICKSSKFVLFAAAVPFQDGDLHVNEQFASYWARLFRQHGYRYIDAIRPTIWDDDNIPFWYRQNIILYVHESEYTRISAAVATASEETQEGCLDLVHPCLYLKKAEESNDLRQNAGRRKDPGLRKSLRIAARIPLTAWRTIARKIGGQA
jgi:hypothetical protein